MGLSIYEQLVAATNELLGPASERFIERQVSNHLHIKPQDLTSKDVSVLSHWLRLSIGMLSDDKNTLHDYELALQRISKDG